MFKLNEQFQIFDIFFSTKLETSKAFIVNQQPFEFMITTSPMINIIAVEFNCTKKRISSNSQVTTGPFVIKKKNKKFKIQVESNELCFLNSILDTTMTPIPIHKENTLRIQDLILEEVLFEKTQSDSYYPIIKLYDGELCSKYSNIINSVLLNLETFPISKDEKDGLKYSGKISDDLSINLGGVNKPIYIIEPTDQYIENEINISIQGDFSETGNYKLKLFVGEDMNNVFEKTQSINEIALTQDVTNTLMFTFTFDKNKFTKNTPHKLFLDFFLDDFLLSENKTELSQMIFIDDGLFISKHTVKLENILDEKQELYIYFNKDIPTSFFNSIFLMKDKNIIETFEIKDDYIQKDQKHLKIPISFTNHLSGDYTLQINYNGGFINCPNTIIIQRETMKIISGLFWHNITQPNNKSFNLSVSSIVGVSKKTLMLINNDNNYSSQSTSFKILDKENGLINVVFDAPPEEGIYRIKIQIEKNNKDKEFTSSQKIIFYNNSVELSKKSAKYKHYELINKDIQIKLSKSILRQQIASITLIHNEKNVEFSVIDGNVISFTSSEYDINKVGTYIINIKSWEEEGNQDVLVTSSYTIKVENYCSIISFEPSIIYSGTDQKLTIVYDKLFTPEVQIEGIVFLNDTNEITVSLIEKTFVYDLNIKRTIVSYMLENINTPYDSGFYKIKTIFTNQQFDFDSKDDQKILLYNNEANIYSFSRLYFPNFIEGTSVETTISGSLSNSIMCTFLEGTKFITRRNDKWIHSINSIGDYTYYLNYEGTNVLLPEIVRVTDKELFVPENNNNCYVNENTYLKTFNSDIFNLEHLSRIKVSLEDIPIKQSKNDLSFTITLDKKLKNVDKQFIIYEKKFIDSPLYKETIHITSFNVPKFAYIDKGIIISGLYCELPKEKLEASLKQLNKEYIIKGKYNKTTKEIFFDIKHVDIYGSATFTFNGKSNSIFISKPLKQVHFTIEIEETELEQSSYKIVNPENDYYINDISTVTLTSDDGNIIINELSFTKNYLTFKVNIIENLLYKVDSLTRYFEDNEHEDDYTYKFKIFNVKQKFFLIEQGKEMKITSPIIFKNTNDEDIIKEFQILSDNNIVLSFEFEEDNTIYYNANKPEVVKIKLPGFEENETIFIISYEDEEKKCYLQRSNNNDESSSITYDCPDVLFTIINPSFGIECQNLFNNNHQTSSNQVRINFDLLQKQIKKEFTNSNFQLSELSQIQFVNVLNFSDSYKILHIKVGENVDIDFNKVNLSNQGEEQIESITCSQKNINNMICILDQSIRLDEKDIYLDGSCINNDIKINSIDIKILYNDPIIITKESEKLIFNLDTPYIRNVTLDLHSQLETVNLHIGNDEFDYELTEQNINVKYMSNFIEPPKCLYINNKQDFVNEDNIKGVLSEQSDNGVDFYLSYLLYDGNTDLPLECCSFSKNNKISEGDYIFDIKLNNNLYIFRKEIIITDIEVEHDVYYESNITFTKMLCDITNDIKIGNLPLLYNNEGNVSIDVSKITDDQTLYAQLHQVTVQNQKLKEIYISASCTEKLTYTIEQDETEESKFIIYVDGGCNINMIKSFIILTSTDTFEIMNNNVLNMTSASITIPNFKQTQQYILNKVKDRYDIESTNLRVYFPRNIDYDNLPIYLFVNENTITYTLAFTNELFEQESTDITLNNEVMKCEHKEQIIICNYQGNKIIDNPYTITFSSTKYKSNRIKEIDIIIKSSFGNVYTCNEDDTSSESLIVEMLFNKEGPSNESPKLTVQFNENTENEPKEITLGGVESSKLIILSRCTNSEPTPEIKIIMNLINVNIEVNIPIPMSSMTKKDCFLCNNANSDNKYFYNGECIDKCPETHNKYLYDNFKCMDNCPDSYKYTQETPDGQFECRKECDTNNGYGINSNSKEDNANTICIPCYVNFHSVDINGDCSCMLGYKLTHSSCQAEESIKEEINDEPNNNKVRNSNRMNNNNEVTNSEENEIDDCIRTNFCLNGGVCEIKNKLLICDCQNGFYGQRCEIEETIKISKFTSYYKRLLLLTSNHSNSITDNFKEKNDLITSLSYLIQQDPTLISIIEPHQLHTIIKDTFIDYSNYFNYTSQNTLEQSDTDIVVGFNNLTSSIQYTLNLIGFNILVQTTYQSKSHKVRSLEESKGDDDVNEIISKAIELNKQIIKAVGDFNSKNQNQTISINYTSLISESKNVYLQLFENTKNNKDRYLKDNLFYSIPIYNISSIHKEDSSNIISIMTFTLNNTHNISSNIHIYNSSTSEFEPILNDIELSLFFPEYNADLYEYYISKGIDIYNPHDKAFTDKCYLSTNFDYDLTQRYRKKYIYTGYTIAYSNNSNCMYQRMNNNTKHYMDIKCDTINTDERICFTCIKEPMLKVDQRYDVAIHCHSSINGVKGNFAFYFYSALFVIGLCIEIPLLLFYIKRIYKTKIHQNNNSINNSNNNSNDNISHNISNHSIIHNQNHSLDSNNRRYINSAFIIEEQEEVNPKHHSCLFVLFRNLRLYHPVIIIFKNHLSDPQVLNVYFLLFKIACLFGFNCVFYTEKLLEHRIHSAYRNSFFYPMKYNFDTVIILSIASTTGINLLFRLIMLVPRSCMLKQKSMFTFNKIFFCQRMVACVLMLGVMIFFYYYSIVWCGVYKNAQKEWMYMGIWCMLWIYFAFSVVYIAIITLIQVTCRKSCPEVVYYLKKLMLF